MNRYISGIMGISCLGWFTYFYLGYLLGNDYTTIKISTSKLALLWAGAIVLQVLEGYWYYSMGEQNCGTQLKLSSILAGSLFVMLAYRYIYSEKMPSPTFLQHLGDRSFGIFFSHLAVMSVLSKVPYYKQYVVYPFNAIIAVLLSYLLVIVANKILGRRAKWLSF